MPVQTLLTLTDLEMMPDDAMHRELVEGELIELPPPLPKHAFVARRVYDALRSFTRQKHLGDIFHEAGYRVRSDKQNWVQPDVSFLRVGRVPPEDAECFDGAPDLAVEVISPSETAADVNQKTELLLGCGAEEVWSVYPRTRSVVVNRAGGVGVVLHETDTLTSPLFPGAAFPVRSFFED